ncbi:M1 family metallopeptidase [Paenibacillus bouchesdurhonensis]|uniref:M1 family metallopeptidase n=1 Tax=Paenibacillus bouchesdurhonensis TaxID=1870990 RepID=UPI000DA62073|nr:M1 family metallopeptidase [Paenibacillus bouchesdurhonensis]
MTRRTFIVSTSILTLCLLGGSIMYMLLRGHQIVPSFASQPQGKPVVTKVPSPLPAESIQQPTAEILSNRVTEYHIDVKLNEVERTLTGTQTLSWTHPGKKTLNELYFHLYPNAFASPETTFMKESGGRLRGDAMPKDGWGSIELNDIRTMDGISLLHRVQYVQPDDGNVNDRTLAKVRLPMSIQGGETITLKLDFTVKLPKIFARMGTANDFVMAGQWFPKLSVYEPAFRRGRSAEGWNLHQYHGNSEFYSDFGIYSVNIDVPSEYTVAATGFPTKQAVQQGERKIVQYYADDVHDFAWAASPNFVYAEEPFSSTEVPGVRIKLYLDPAHEDLKDRYFYAAKVALSNFSKWYGKYPYSTLSIVVPPADGNGAGGMEYPTLITAFGATSDSPGYDELERTVIHEIGHQFFYGMVANNEFEEAWLDEAFTSYAEDRLMDQEFGITISLPIQSAFIHNPQPLTQPSWEFGNADTYAKNVYHRGKLVLLDIERQIGSKAMNRTMSLYAHKYRFKHPTTADFQRVLEQTTGRSWKTYFNQYVYDGKMADYAIENITTLEIRENNEVLYESIVDIRRKGGTHPKVPILFTFQDGHTVRKVWNGEKEKEKLMLRYKEPLAWAMIDPDYTLVLENKHINNYFKANLDEKISTRSNVSMTKLIEILTGSFLW